MKRAEIGLPELHVQLRITNRLLAAQLRSVMNQQQLVKLLASTGADSPEIADVLDTTPATVRVALQRLRSEQNRTATSETSSPEELSDGPAD